MSVRQNIKAGAAIEHWLDQGLNIYNKNIKNTDSYITVSLKACLQNPVMMIYIIDIG